MNTWTLSGSDLVGFLDETAASPAMGSPLLGLEAPPRQGRPPSVDNRPALADALARIVRPDVVLGMVLYAPAREPEYSWFYAHEGDAGFAFHRDDGDDRHEIAWPMDRYVLLESSQAVLSSELLPKGGGTALVLDRNEFEAMAAIVDVMQENALVGLLYRDPSREMRFSENDIVATCNLSRQSPDPRWMVPRATLFAPIGLSFSEESVRGGLESLVRSGLAAREGGFYSPGSELGLACSLLGVCNGLCAMSVRRKRRARDDGSGWDHTHFAGMRGADGSLWLFEFTNIESDAFEVELTSVSESVMHGYFKAAVSSGRVPSRPTGDAPGEAPAKEEPPRLDQPAAAPSRAAHAPESTGARYCRRCGAPLPSGAGFCSACGEEVRKPPR